MLDPQLQPSDATPTQTLHLRPIQIGFEAVRSCFDGQPNYPNGSLLVGCYFFFDGHTWSLLVSFSIIERVCPHIGCLVDVPTELYLLLNGLVRECTAQNQDLHFVRHVAHLLLALDSVKELQHCVKVIAVGSHHPWFCGQL